MGFVREAVVDRHPRMGGQGLDHGLAEAAILDRIVDSAKHPGRVQTANDWQTKTSASMPAAVIAQPIMIASGPAPAAVFCGRLKTPEPTIDPMTNAVRTPSRSFRVPLAAAAWGEPKSVVVTGYLLADEDAAPSETASRAAASMRIRKGTQSSRSPCRHGQPAGPRIQRPPASSRLF